MANKTMTLAQESRLHYGSYNSVTLREMLAQQERTRIIAPRDDSHSQKLVSRNIRLITIEMKRRDMKIGGAKERSAAARQQVTADALKAAGLGKRKRRSHGSKPLTQESINKRR